MRALGGAIKWILVLSILFELWVAIFVQEPVAPNFTDYGDDAPMAFYWSRGLLFQGGPIEGIVASRNLLGMVALLGLIVFGSLLAAGSIRRAQGIGWLVVAGTVLLLTRSATVILVAVIVLVALGFALWARKRRARSSPRRVLGGGRRARGIRGPAARLLERPARASSARARTSPAASTSGTP